VKIWINRMARAIEERDVRRVYRNSIGDWCADVSMAGGWILDTVFDHHLSVTMLRLLQNEGAVITEDVIDQGAEGEDMRSHARRADDR
jgi:hypothetical protein